MQSYNLKQLISSAKPKNGRFFCMAIDGRGGSGKSALLEHLRTDYPDWTFLEGDDYFEPVSDPVVWGAFNNDRFQAEVIEPLKTGDTFTSVKYDWHHDVQPKTVTVKKVFCLERCFSFEFKLDWDLKIWVETPKEVCFERGARRDTHDLGSERATKAWQIWQHQEDEYIDRVKPLDIADIVIDGTKLFEEQIS